MKKQITKRMDKPYPYNLIAEIYDDDAKGDEVLDNDRMLGLEYAVASLSDREQEVVQMRYGECLTLEDCAMHFGLTRERIRQVEAKAVRKLRHPSRLQYIAKGYAIASGELEAAVRARHEAEIDRLEAMYASMIQDKAERIMGRVMPPEHILVRGIDRLGLSVRAGNVLRRAGVDTIADFMMLTDAEMMRMPHMGVKSMEEIHDIQNRVRRGEYE